MNKYALAQWVIKVINSCEFTDQVRNSVRLAERHILTFRDPLLYELIISEWSRKMRSTMPRLGELERQYKLKLKYHDSNK